MKSDIIYLLFIIILLTLLFIGINMMIKKNLEHFATSCISSKDETSCKKNSECIWDVVPTICRQKMCEDYSSSECPKPMCSVNNNKKCFTPQNPPTCSDYKNKDDCKPELNCSWNISTNSCIISPE